MGFSSNLDDGDLHVLSNALFSANEGDRNGEVANVVDGLFAIARALDRVADTLRGNPDRGLSTYHPPPGVSEEFLALLEKKDKT
jgi:hypothetical protein